MQPLSFVSIPMTLYPYIKLLCDTTLIFRCPFAKYFVFVFSKINFLPYYISAPIRYTHSLFKSHFSEKTKNILFFAIVLQILLFISGTVETNPGSDTSKKNNLSFAEFRQPPSKRLCKNSAY